MINYKLLFTFIICVCKLSSNISAWTTGDGRLFRPQTRTTSCQTLQVQADLVSHTISEPKNGEIQASAKGQKDSGLSNAEISRYSRHLVLGDVGVRGQEALKYSKVLVIGAGGLGSPCLLYLAAAGVGTIGIVVSS